MQIHIGRQPIGFGGGKECIHVIDITVHSTGTHEPHEMEIGRVSFGMLKSLDKDGIAPKSPICNTHVDAREILVDDLACSHIEMTCLGIAIFSTRQTDSFATRGKLGVRIGHAILFHVWRVGSSDGVACIGRTNSPTIKNE